MWKGVLSLLFLEGAEPESLVCPLAVSHGTLHVLYFCSSIYHITVYFLHIFPCPIARFGNAVSIKTGSSVVYDGLNRASVNIGRNEC